MQIAARATDTRGHAHAQPVGCLQRATISSHVAHAGLGILGDAQRRGEIRRGVEARRGNWHRQARQTAAGLAQLIAGDDHFLAHAANSPQSERSDWRSRASTPRRSLPPAAPCRSHRSSPKRPALRPPPECRSAARCESVTFVKKNARRSSSGMPPRNCQRTSGCSSVSLLIGRSMRTSRPCASSLARCV